MPTPIAALARRLLSFEFVPEAVLLAGLTFFFLDETDAATSAFKSGKAVAIMTVATLGWLGTRLLLARLLPFAVARAAVFSVAAVVALSVVVLPAYRNQTVVESFPTAAALPTGPAPTGSASAPDVTTPMPIPPAESAAPVAGEPVAAPTTTTTTTATRAPRPAPTTTTTAPVPAGAATEPASGGTTTPPETAAPSAPPPTAPAAAPAGPERLRAGPIHGIDHRASGTAVIYRQPDGRYVIGLEDIDIQPGPDYDLYVVPGENREDTKGGVRLGDLRGNRGTQFYEVPEGVDLESGPWTVLVWCQTFAVPVAGATPS